MTKIQLEKTLLEMINSSKMMINRRQFRTLYLVDDIKKTRNDKLNKIYNSNYVNKNTMKFSESDSFMSIYYCREYLYIKTNSKFTNIIKQLFNNKICDMTEFFENFLSKHFNLDFSQRRIFYQAYCYEEHFHLNEQKFEHDYTYKNLSEDKTLAFSFQKYKFDICDYSYTKIVNLFKSNKTK
jgi:hypothetical protein